MNFGKVLSVAKAVGRVVSKPFVFLFKVATDEVYRESVVTGMMSWKFILVASFVGIILVTSGAVVYRWSGLKSCIGEQWDTGRETKYGFLFDSCVIDTGKVDANGNKIWNKVKRDIAQGTDLN